MQLADVGFQGLWNDAGALGAHIGLTSCRWESHGFTNVILGNAERDVGQICEIQIVGYLWQNRHQNIIQSRVIRFLGFIKGQLDDLSLTLGPGVITVHFS